MSEEEGTVTLGSILEKPFVVDFITRFREAGDSDEKIAERIRLILLEVFKEEPVEEIDLTNFHVELAAAPSTEVRIYHVEERGV